MKEIFRQRLYSSGLLTPFDNPLKAIQNTVGIQSQEQAHAAEMSILLRTKNFKKAELEKLYKSHQVVQAWANRWTLHLFDYADWELLINARQAENLPDNYFQGRKDEALSVLATISQEIIQQGQLDKNQILQIISEELPNFDKSSYVHYTIMHRLVQSGTAFMDAASPANNRLFIFAKNFKRESAESALEKLIPRYLKGFSPANLDDFVKWSGIRKTTAKTVWERLELTSPKFPSKLKADISNKLILGSRFDSLMTGYLDKTWLVPEDKISSMWTKNGFLLAPIIYHGKLIGHWNYKISGHKIEFKTEIWAKYESQQLEDKFDEIAELLDKTKVIRSKN